jgi:hypothetical protein
VMDVPCPHITACKEAGLSLARPIRPIRSIQLWATEVCQFRNWGHSPQDGEEENGGGGRTVHKHCILRIYFNDLKILTLKGHKYDIKDITS